MQLFVTVSNEGIVIAPDENSWIQAEFQMQKETPKVEQFAEAASKAINAFCSSGKPADFDRVMTMERQKNSENPAPLLPDHEAYSLAKQKLDFSASFTVSLDEKTRAFLYAMGILMDMPDDQEDIDWFLAMQHDLLVGATKEQRAAHECGCLQSLLNEVHHQSIYVPDFWTHMQLNLNIMLEEGLDRFIDLSPVKEFLMDFCAKVNEATQLH